RVGLVVNQTSTIGEDHLVDRLLLHELNIKKIFSPEHGFRGKADAGQQIRDGKDLKTGIPLLSLYGKKKKPSPSDLANLDIIVFDIQDVGARFYTYISTLAYLMEACAENNLPLLILDRPNPNGHFVDGPVLDLAYRSFVGMHEVPIIHGMTVGEYARMLNGEGWLKNGVVCDVRIITCINYSHKVFYNLPVKPSPNLPNMRSIYLYPSLCLFEGTEVSIGRGTDRQFQVIGHPDFKMGDFSFIPSPREGAQSPKLQGKTCQGYDLSYLELTDLRRTKELNLNYLIDFYHNFSKPTKFFLKNNFFDKLAGSSVLRKQIQNGFDAATIRESWQADLNEFKKKRQQYLLYEDF
ncbi:MAG: exo-beta-N-acetylmuramidase NamZ domain-containing protein, partial [Saprospiraceae bacterium]